MNLKQITQKDQLDLKKIYFDSIISIDEKIYTSEQKRAWASQAWNNKYFNLSLKEGRGWLINEKEKIIAFASRYPNNRISLLYCRGDSQRKGYGTKLLQKIEKEAIKEGLPCLTTEASLEDAKECDPGYVLDLNDNCVKKFVLPKTLRNPNVRVLRLM